ncbi:MAG: alpha/beta hydrolase [Sphaerochaetaceae bacterium]|nr:alpha/beta hydrolase [Sphaerochaetaceae bacterium]
MVAVLIVAAILFVLAWIIFAIASILVEKIAHPKVHTKEFIEGALKKYHNIDASDIYNNYKNEQFTCKSSYGYNLRGDIIYANQQEDNNNKIQKTVILVHGYTSTRALMLSYGKIYLELGFNIVLYDHRHHGDSDKGPNTFCSLGYYESQDLVEIAYFVKSKFPENCIWGLQGESMGATTVMLAAHKIRFLSFAVEDCGFSSIKKQMQTSLRSYHLPDYPFMNIGTALLRGRYNIDLDKADAVKTIEKTDIPMLFCHGDIDKFVPTAMVYDVFNAKKDKKKLQLFEGARHAESICLHPQQYKEVLEDFLKEYNLG